MMMVMKRIIGGKIAAEEGVRAASRKTSKGGGLRIEVNRGGGRAVGMEIVATCLLYAYGVRLLPTYGERCYGEQTVNMRLSNEQLQRTFEPAPETQGNLQRPRLGLGVLSSCTPAKGFDGSAEECEPHRDSGRSPIATTMKPPDDCLATVATSHERARRPRLQQPRSNSRRAVQVLKRE